MRRVQHTEMGLIGEEFISHFRPFLRSSSEQTQALRSLVLSSLLIVGLALGYVRPSFESPVGSGGHLSSLLVDDLYPLASWIFVCESLVY